MKLILASKSPCRREILTMFGLHPEIITLETEEDFDRSSVTPEELVMGLACRKVRAADAYRRELYGGTETEVLLSADTVVALDGQVLEKPVDEQDAERMLRALSGRTHEVFTGIAAIHGNRLAVDVQRTGVTFRHLSDSDIRRYIASGEPMDKAGAYGAQKLGGLLIESFSGDFFNVVGLPAVRVDEMFRAYYGFGLLDLE